ncbi:MAG: SOSS complex subunit B family protein [Thermoplasmata archaeon]
MKVNDLKVNSKVDSIELKITSKEEPRQFQSKFGSSGKVCNAIGEDDTGKVKITLWNEEIEKVNVEAKIKITNGYVKEWNGELQISAGKYGSLEIVE